MKKPVKISLIVIGILLLIIIAIALLISPIAKRYIEKNSKELVGRVIIMDKFRFNMFAGSLKIVKFDMKEQNEQESFITFDTLSVKVKLLDFLRHKVTVQKIHLSEIRLHVWQKGDDFNFSDMVKKFESTNSAAPPPPAEKSKPWEIGIYDIQLRGGDISYDDLSVGSKWNMEDLHLTIPGVYFSGEETDIGFNLLFADGGKLGSSLQYDIEKSTYHIHIDLENFSIQGLLPYLRQNMRVGSLSGLLDANISINGDLRHVMNSIIRGKMSLRSLDMRDDRNELVLAADHLSMDMEEVSFASSKYILNDFSSQGVSTRYVMEKDSSSNFTYLIKGNNTTPPDTIHSGKESKPDSTHLAIRNMELRGIHVEFKDNALQMPFTYDMKDIHIVAKNFDPDKSNDIYIQGKLGATGMADIHWLGNFNDLSNLNLKINFNSVEISDFTPYSMEYFAYPITNGIMTFSSQNIINSSMLNGTNDLDIFKCNVDKKSQEVKPVMKVPLRLAVYVLKDRNDKIKLNLPVEGDIRSPKFSYKKIIINALVNVLVKVSLAPLDFLAGSMGFNAEQLDAIEFIALQEEYTSVQYDRFNQLSAIILAKPDLSLSIMQDINYTQAIKEQSLLDLKTDYYLKKNRRKETDSLDMLAKADIAKIKDNDPDLIKYANEQLKQATNEDIYIKASTLYQDRVQEEIKKLAEKRNQLLRDYLVTRMQVPAANLNVATVPMVQNKAYEGKSVFRTSLSLPGEEPLTKTPETAESTENTENKDKP